MNTGNPTSVNRRKFIASTVGIGAMAAIGSKSAFTGSRPSTGRLKQAVCKGVFRGKKKYSFEEMCKETANLGFHGIDLVGPESFADLKKYGLVPTMVRGAGGIKNGGINDPQHDSTNLPKLRQAIKDAASVKARNVITLSGTRDTGISDEQGLENCVKFLNKIKSQAEDAEVVICMELLNSKVNHPGYMCDHTAWGVEMCKQVNSPSVKLLYDIYHMQIMEGDIIRTIQDNFEYIGHFHTAGNPGRHEFDETQELYYPPICKTIADLGYDGYFAHEYTPTKDPLGTLKKMRDICIV
jgi:hydroxypyruvate isomerase